MLADFTTRYYFLVTVGASVGLTGLVLLLSPRLRRSMRFGLTVGAAALPILGLSQLQSGLQLPLAAAGTVAGLLTLAWLIGTRPFVSLLSHRKYQLMGAVAFGAVAVVGSGVWYDQALEADTDAAFQELDLTDYQPEMVPFPSSVTTDRGQSVEVKRALPTRQELLPTLDEVKLKNLKLTMSVIRLSPADCESNCHGWVFAGGRCWVGGLQVDPILKDNGYQPVERPAVGDLVIYRGPSGNVTHTGLVRATPTGLPILVESKWGSLGVFLHAVDKTPYGTEFTAYHSNRAGHLLTGLTTTPVATKPVLP